MVVTSEVKAMADLVQKFKTGLVARTDSELVEAIIRLLTDTDLSQEMAENARNYVKNHVSWQIIASKHIDVYNKAIAKK
ncbi:MAG: glycosyltransferase [Candidatus Aminicenantales bacterium]